MKKEDEGKLGEGNLRREANLVKETEGRNLKNEMGGRKGRKQHE